MFLNVFFFAFFFVGWVGLGLDFFTVPVLLLQVFLPNSYPTKVGSSQTSYCYFWVQK